ncbi:YolD-like family protein [Staphylococcus argenteus]|uniref:YolD-like family protein n=2 Tax=Staphylococcus TaxID=1279 RepID=UPI000B594B51|nr:YolD-like family protein [Staphylococcus argenteus]
MKKRIINPNAPDEYKYETDYRKIPRKYLDQNIPQGRGKIKWKPFKTMPELFESINQHVEDQNKVEKAKLTDEQLDMLDNVVQYKIYKNEKADIEYWKNGYYFTQTAYIKEINSMKKTIVISNENGNEYVELSIDNIKNIE